MKQLLVLSLLLFAATSLWAYSTPDTSVTWDMDDLVTNSAGAVTGAAGAYVLTESLVIAPSDTITMSPGDTISVTAGSSFHIDVAGTLNAVGTSGSPITFTSASGTPAAGDWYGIYVYEEGSVNLTWCTIAYCSYGVYFYEIGVDPGDTGVSSSVKNCTIQNVNSYGILTEYYAAPALTITDNTLDGTGTSGSGIFLYYFGFPAALTISGNTIDGFGSDGIRFDSGGPGAVIDGNTITNNSGMGIKVLVGGWLLTITDNTITGNSGEGIYLNGGGSTGGDGCTISGNTITNNSSGIYSKDNSGLTITGNTLSNNTGDSGLKLNQSFNNTIKNNTMDANSFGIYSEYSYPGRTASKVTYQWIEVNENNADDWSRDLNNACLAEAAIGFTFPLGDQNYTHAQVQTNGSIELGVGAASTNNITDYQGRGHLIDQYWSSTVIFAHTDEYCDSAGETASETHNSVSVTMDGWGWKHFNAGDTDGDGKTVTEECTVFRWYMPLFEDYNPVPWNDFQVVLYPDGRIRWNSRAMNGVLPEHGDFCGVYAGADTDPFEIVATYGDRSKGSYKYKPSSYSDKYTKITSNTITNSGGEGIYAYECYDYIISGNTFTNNGYGVYVSSSDRATVSSNTVTGSTNEGICLNASEECLVKLNTVNSNDVGIYLTTADNNTIKQNECKSNTNEGLYLDSTSGNTFFGNTSTLNDVGVTIITGSTGDTFEDNNLNDNISWNMWNDLAAALDMTGNFWGDGLNAAAIDATIYDDEETAGAKGVVTFDPFRTTPYVIPKPKEKKDDDDDGGCTFAGNASAGGFLALMVLGLACLFLMRKKD